MSALLITGGFELLPIQLGRYAKRLYKFSRSVQYAGPDIELLRKEVRLCRSFALMFHESTKEIQGPVRENARKEGIDQMLVEQTTEAYRRIERLLERLEPLQKTANSSPIERLLAVIRWNLGKQEIQIPIATLASVKSSLNLLLSILMLDKNLSQIRTDSTLSQTEREALLSTIQMLRKEVRQHERALEETKKMLKQKHGKNENYHQSCVEKLSQIIDVIHDIGRGPISEARQLYGVSKLSSPVSASSRQPGESFPSRRREFEISPAATIRFSMPNRRPRSGTSRTRDAKVTGDPRQSVSTRPSITSRSESRTSSSASQSRALIIRSDRNSHGESRHSGGANIYEASEGILEIQPNALVLRPGNRNRRMSVGPTSVEDPQIAEETGQGYPVYHEYEDNSREVYTLKRAPSYVGSSESGSESAVSSQQLFPSETYVPMPPFDNTDLTELRKRQKRKKKGQDKQE